MMALICGDWCRLKLGTRVAVYTGVSKASTGYKRDALSKHPRLIGKRVFAFTVCCLVLAIAFHARAEATSPSPTSDVGAIDSQHWASVLIDQYVETALANSIALAALSARQRSAQEMISATAALPDPMVGVTYQSVGAPWRPMSPMSMVVGEFSQPLPGFGKRQARREVAKAEAELKRLEGSALKVRIVDEVRRLFSDLYAIDRQEQALRAGAELIELTKSAVLGQSNSGKSELEAFARTELEAARLDEELNDVSANRMLVVERLNRLTRRPPNATIPRILALPQVSIEEGTLEKSGATHSANLKLGRAAVRLAERRHENALNETRPNYLIGVSGGSSVGGDAVLILRFGIELPIWRASKQQPLARAAQHELEAAQDDYTELKLDQDSALRALLTRFRRDEAQIRLYRDSIIPKATFALTAARNDYIAGRGTFAAIVDDLRQLTEAQVGLSRREADRVATWAEIRALTEPSQ
jgi:outer membrane protein TolC